jgi:hypothetical protein
MHAHRAATALSCTLVTIGFGKRRTMSRSYQLAWVRAIPRVMARP